MKIISTNIGKPQTITWNGKTEQTGIFKYPLNEGLDLKKEIVSNDTIIDRVHHGGSNKACYIFSADEYAYWKEIYPDLDWDWGMFGENLTIEGLDENTLRVGNIYKIGSALVQVSQPREPCYKLGVRFQDQGILKKFIDRVRPGTYLRVLEEGHVNKGDEMELVEESSNEFSITHFHNLLYSKEKSKELLDLFMSNDAVPQYKKEKFKKYL
ncbi:MAG: sulfurase [Pseudozobellia sp.]|nr:sulfurase [Pseudozobellia sp.]|tara:strand:- start:3049 stop:3681 length:633 start_codon:yes stop_codon:yes gene_type:complete